MYRKRVATDLESNQSDLVTCIEFECECFPWSLLHLFLSIRNRYLSSPIRTYHLSVSWTLRNLYLLATPLYTHTHTHTHTFIYIYIYGTAVAQWLRCCATIRKFAGSIRAGVSGFFIDIKSFWSHYGFGVDSASNRKEYQEYFLGVKAASAFGWQPTTILCRCHEIWEP